MVGSSMVNNAVLCFVDKTWAYFTTKPIESQWGDDWDDAPYEHNAGEPYGPCWHNEPAQRNNPSVKRGWKPGTTIPLDVGEICRCQSCNNDWNDDGTPRFHVFKVAFEGPFVTPRDGSTNSQWSVEQINAKGVPWLRSDPVFGRVPCEIWAGTRFVDFRRIIEMAGGHCFVGATIDTEPPVTSEVLEGWQIEMLADQCAEVVIRGCRWCSPSCDVEPSRLASLGVSIKDAVITVLKTNFFWKPS